jgi:hypothetical protein
VLSCADPQRLQQICDGLSAEKIDRLLRKWLHFLPHPFTAADQKAGHRYDISILQAEFSLTQVLDRPVHGRLFFEQVIRDNLDLGRPDEVQLIFARRITRRTPGRFRTRILTQGVTPSRRPPRKIRTSPRQWRRLPERLQMLRSPTGWRLCNSAKHRIFESARSERKILFGGAHQVRAARRTITVTRGTDGSNPAPSSGESLCKPDALD